MKDNIRLASGNILLNKSCSPLGIYIHKHNLKYIIAHFISSTDVRVITLNKAQIQNHESKSLAQVKFA